MQSVAAQFTLGWLSRLLDESILANPQVILVSQRGYSEDRAPIIGRLRGTVTKAGSNLLQAISEGADLFCHRAGVSSMSSTSFEKKRLSHGHVEHEHCGVVEAELEHDLEKSCNRTKHGALKLHNPANQTKSELSSLP